MDNLQFIFTRRYMHLLSDMVELPAEQCGALAQLLQVRGISVESVSTITRIAFGLAQDRGIKTFEVEYCISVDDDSKWIDYVLKVDRGVAEITDMNEELAERLACGSSGSEVDRLSTAFVARFSSLTTSDRSSSN